MISPQLKSVLEMNKITNRNLQTLAQRYEEYGQEGSFVNAEKQRKVQLVTTSKEVMDEYREELYQHLLMYISDVDVVTRLTQSELSDDVIRELTINWQSKYESKVDTLAGTNISLAKFVDFLKDIAAVNVNAKGKRSTNDTMGKSEASEPNTNDNSMEIAEAEVVDPVLTQMDDIRKLYFNNKSNDKIPSTYELADAIEKSLKQLTDTTDLKKAKSIVFENSTSTAIHNKLVDYFMKYIKMFVRENLIQFFTNYFETDGLEKYKALLKLYNNKKNYENLYQAFKNRHDGEYQQLIENQRYEIEDYAPKKLATKNDQPFSKIKACSNIVLTLLYDAINNEGLPTGSGLKQTKALKSYQKPIHKYYVDKNKLNDGILEIRYQANKHLSNLKPTKITPKLAIVLRQMMQSGDIDLKDYALLTAEEKVLTKKLVRMFQLDIYLMDDKNLLKNQYEILQGEKDAGNNSDVLANKINDYKHLMN